MIAQGPNSPVLAVSSSVSVCNNRFQQTLTFHRSASAHEQKNQLNVNLQNNCCSSTITSMKYLLALAALAITAFAAPGEIYPAPCGRSVPSGRCTTEPACLQKGGFYVQRDCSFYNVGDVGCCYNIPE
ncbi:hypothetical protein B0H66DRAFT_639234 [Apodospora peruviana]|uniref:Uncharacterized protein n=1 Tax=Apodospora peruviana TaxID=516989 RepID=A0AAE0ID36_9PEZI|nr:hypothetical protein B0H66DRAFT_639234 [Apodospora peruviana]